MGNKIIALKFTSPHSHLDHTMTVIRELVFVDEANGERAIEKIQKRVDKMYKEKLFVKGAYALSSVETLWEDL